MRRLACAVVLAAACSGQASPSAFELEREAAEAASERDAARRDLRELGPSGAPWDSWRRWRARARLERAVLDLDRLQRRRLHERARTVREAEARATGAWEAIDMALDSASAALRAADPVVADSHYARASRLLDARAPASPPLSRPALPPPAAGRGTRALLAERVRLDERLARLEERRIEIAGTILRLEEDRARLAGLGHFRGVLDRDDPSAVRTDIHASTAARVLDARLDALRAEERRREAEEVALRVAIERIDGAIAAGTGTAPGIPPEGS